MPIPRCSFSTVFFASVRQPIPRDDHAISEGVSLTRSGQWRWLNQPAFRDKGKLPRRTKRATEQGQPRGSGPADSPYFGHG